MPKTMMDKPTSEEEYFNIDWNTRIITIPDGITCIGVYNDKDTNRIYFRCPVAYGDYRVADFGLRVNYLNIGRSGEEYDGDIYFVDDAAADGEYMTFSWLVGRRAYLEEGNTRFIVCCKIVDTDDNVVNELNTTVSTLPVLEGLEVDAQPEVDYPDYLEELLKKVDTAVQHVEVNGVEQPKVDGTVDLDIEKASYEEDTEAIVLSDMVSEKAIECIKVNGEAQVVENATVDIEVPTKVSELENDTGYITEDNIPTKVSELENDAQYAKEDDTISGITMNDKDVTIENRTANIILKATSKVPFVRCEPDESSVSIECDDIDNEMYEGVAGTMIAVRFDISSFSKYNRLSVNHKQADIKPNIYCTPGATVLFVLNGDWPSSSIANDAGGTEWVPVGGISPCPTMSWEDDQNGILSLTVPEKTAFFTDQEITSSPIPEDAESISYIRLVNSYNTEDQTYEIFDGPRDFAYGTRVTFIIINDDTVVIRRVDSDYKEG